MSHYTSRCSSAVVEVFESFERHGFFSENRSLEENSSRETFSCVNGVRHCKLSTETKLGASGHVAWAHPLVLNRFRNNRYQSLSRCVVKPFLISIDCRSGLILGSR